MTLILNCIILGCNLDPSNNNKVEFNLIRQNEISIFDKAGRTKNERNAYSS